MTSSTPCPCGEPSHHVDPEASIPLSADKTHASTYTRLCKRCGVLVLADVLRAICPVCRLDEVNGDVFHLEQSLEKRVAALEKGVMEFAETQKSIIATLETELHAAPRHEDCKHTADCRDCSEEVTGDVRPPPGSILGRLGIIETVAAPHYTDWIGKRMPANIAYTIVNEELARMPVDPPVCGIHVASPLRELMDGYVCDPCIDEHKAERERAEAAEDGLAPRIAALESHVGGMNQSDLCARLDIVYTQLNQHSRNIIDIEKGDRVKLNAARDQIRALEKKLRKMTGRYLGERTELRRILDETPCPITWERLGIHDEACHDHDRNWMATLTRTAEVDGMKVARMACVDCLDDIGQKATARAEAAEFARDQALVEAKGERQEVAVLTRERDQLDIEHSAAVERMSRSESKLLQVERERDALQVERDAACQKLTICGNCGVEEDEDVRRRCEKCWDLATVAKTAKYAVTQSAGVRVPTDEELQRVEKRIRMLLSKIHTATEIPDCLRALVASCTVPVAPLTDERISEMIRVALHAIGVRVEGLAGYRSVAIAAVRKAMEGDGR